MKKLFTIACTLVLGSALSFAQAASTSQTTPAGDQTKTSTSTSTKKHHHHGTKKSSKRLRRRPQAHHPNKSLFIVIPSGLMRAAFFSPSKKGFPFPASLLRMLHNNSLPS